jgi:hypothetical protein
MAAIAGITRNPELTEAKLQAMMNKAVAENTRISGTITGNLQVTGRTTAPTLMADAPAEPEA